MPTIENRARTIFWAIVLVAFYAAIVGLDLPQGNPAMARFEPSRPTRGARTFHDGRRAPAGAVLSR